MTQENKHTLGRWKVCPTNCEDVRAQDGTLLFSGQLPVTDPVNANPVGKANASLIAAAPDMLKLLQAIHDAQLIKDIDPLRHDAISTAIAKARGQV